ncbi:tubulin-like doman-containing protein [Accumulibacter sp.]|uniref:tubulin-like doman-containing protein n=1 Tax=Accumulibacter sp. TaxID=2053492 RepID=UPI0025E78BC8|nr:tubulin-like doman-containing protein [Accumulibacter sp.]MCM8595566.1 tubulin-like doman-containing protein [Accumulibacter sp.]MCM8625063.1 tubulin-like doman-containing protein [Accumulibacter sp.]MDS4049714.1 tubulin-like doman-containing protein [Accumulibacter sp.]
MDTQGEHRQMQPTHTPEFGRTLLIGLGGAGELMVMNVKRLFFDTYGVLPPSIRILCMDTDVGQERLRSRVSDREYGLDADEFLHLKVPAPRQYVEESRSPVADWYTRPVSVSAMVHGAGGIRQNGRLALFYHIVEIKARLDRLVTDLQDAQLAARMGNARAGLGASTDFELSNRDVEVFVCGSLAGGTGSGTFVDMGILLRALMPQALIHGCFVLDWPYRNKPHATRVRGNAYAALAEIDHLQSIVFGAAQHVSHYTVHYADRTIEVREPPYSLFHLIDGRNEHGQNIDNVSQICETVATAVFLSVSRMADRVRSVVDNLLAHINVGQPRVWNGRSARYSSLGVSSIYYPARELHRLLAADSALQLCMAAIGDLEKGAISVGGATAPASDTHTQQGLKDFLVRHGIDRRETIRNGVCPPASEVGFAVERFELADMSLLRPKKEGALAQCQTQVDDAAAGDGKAFHEAKLEVIERKLSDLARDTTLSSAARRAWCQAAIECFGAWDAEAARELSAATMQVNDLGAQADAQLEVVEKAHYFPVFGGPRKSAAEHWASVVLGWLRANVTRQRLEHERLFHAAVISLVQRQMAPPVKAADVGAELQATARELRERLRIAKENFEEIKGLPTQVLLGYGDIVVLPEGRSIALAESQRVDYDEFLAEREVHTPDRYLQIAREHPGGVAAFLSDHCEHKLAFITEVGVQQALEAIGAHRGDADAYTRKRIDDLFRLASPMWSFNRSSLNELMALEYDRIVNLGVLEQETGRQQYDGHVRAVKARYHLRSDHTFSTTGDPYRIWLLAYAAALPVYFLSDLDQSRERYEGEITPTYHLDPYFEMNVPDLFPVDDVANRTLRVLAMAIVKGIDVVVDERLIRSHKFTCSIPAVKELNFGDPVVWAPTGKGPTGTPFRDMYLEVTQSYTLGEKRNLLDPITAALRERLAKIPRDELRRLIGEHITKLKRKLAERDFSKLYSARLTYREVKLLEDFLSPKAYAMDLDRYLDGRL